MADIHTTGIRIRGLRKRYGEGETAVDALKGVDMQVSPGEVVGLVGPSGSGKSTLLKCLGAVIEPTDGQMTLGEEVIYDNGWKIRDLRALRRDKIGFVFQSPYLTPILKFNLRRKETMKAIRFTTLILAAGMFFATASGVIVAETGEQAVKQLALRGIMKNLGSNMQVITDGISREDWALVEKTAPLIADHPQPPMSEKAHIMSLFGPNMGKFKSYDEETHKAAEFLGEAAGKQDGQAVIAAFQSLQTACFNCHQEFRKPFIEHFYGLK